MDSVIEELATIRRIDAIPVILDIICNTTGMGFAVLSRVTGKRWIAYSVCDNIGLGLLTGDELVLETTLCKEIAEHRKAIAIDHADLDPVYAGHPTMEIYGLQSYIAMPITLADGSFFGSICAIDPRPMRVNTFTNIGMLKLFAELIVFHLRDAGVISAAA